MTRVELPDSIRRFWPPSGAGRRLSSVSEAHAAPSSAWAALGRAVVDPRRLAVALLLFAAVVSLWNLGGGSLRMWDEALGAERAREMIETGDWISPRFQTAPDFNKPPLYYWCAAAVYRLAGLGEFGIRFPSVLFALGCLALCFYLAKTRSGSAWAGVLCLALLALDPFWTNHTREGGPDSGLLLSLLAAAALLRGTAARPPRTIAAIAAGAALGLGCLMKNPLAFVALIVPAAELALDPSRRARWPAFLGAAALAVLTALLVAFPWYWIQTRRWGAEFLRFHFGYNMVERMRVPIQGHDGRSWFYLVDWLRQSPLSLGALVLGVAWAAVKDRRALTLALPWLALTAVLFLGLSMAGSKRAVYLVFLLPSSAIAAAVLLDAAARSLNASRPRFAVAAACALAATAFFFSRYDADMEYSKKLKRVALALRADSAPGDTVWTIDIPVNVILFYSRRAVGYGAFDDLPERFAKASRPAGRPVYFVFRKRDKEQVDPILASLGRNPADGAIVYEGKHIVLRIPPPRRSSRAAAE